MTVYLVMELIDEEYGSRTVVGAYAQETDALAWVEAHQSEVSVWFSDDPVLLYTIDCVEVM